MNNNETNIKGVSKIRDLQTSFDKSMKILESHIAESITNKDKLETINKDLKMANEKFLEAERHLEDLKVDLENTTVDIENTTVKLNDIV